MSNQPVLLSDLVDVHKEIAEHEEVQSTRLVDGETYDVTIICLDIAGHSERVENQPTEAKKVLTKFRSLVKKCVGEYHGEIWNWAGDGATLAFWGKRRRARGVLTGIKILQNLSLFNMDASRNSTEHPIEIRMAGNDGKIEYCASAGEISSGVINDTAKLESLRTRAGEFNIYGNLFHSVDARIRNSFVLIEESFRKKQVYTYAGIKRQDRLPDKDVDILLEGAVQTVSEIVLACGRMVAGVVDRESVKEVSHSAKSFYGAASDFYRSFVKVDPQWSKKYLQSLLATTSQFSRLEKVLWEELKGLLQSAASAEGASEEFRLLRSFLINTHAKQELDLASLGKRLREALGHQRDPREVTEQVTRLINADELEKTSAFASLMGRNAHSDIVTLLSQDGETPTQLALTLWSLADLLLMESASRVAQEEKDTAQEILSILSSRVDTGPYVKVLQLFLKDTQPLHEFFLKKLRAAGVDPRVSDIEILWRSVIAHHQEVSFRFQAATHAPVSALWPLVAYHKTPLTSLWVITQRVKDREETELKKIFFDCIRPRLMQCLNGVVCSLEEIKVIGEIIDLLFNFEFFVEDSYFRDFDALLSLYSSQLTRLELDPPSFEAQIEKFRNQRTGKPGETQKLILNVENLPLPVQRHLARYGSFANIFACHEDPRIAAETGRYFVDPKKIDDLVAFCLRTNRIPNSSMLGSLKATHRKRLITGLDDSTVKTKNSALEAMLKRRLSGSDLEWLTKRRRAM